MANKTGNPFLDQDFSEIFDFKKYAEQFQVPGVDTSALLETQRRNIEAVTQANRVAFEGAQAVAQRQSEIMRQAMQEAAEAMQQVTSAGTPEDRMNKQTEIAKKAFETALKNAKELADMSAKSHSEAVELINKRVTESFDELRDTLQSIVKKQQAAGGGSMGGATKRAAE